jgi:translation initiation factor IF-3
VKKNKILAFLDKGHKVRITLILKGRELAFPEKATAFLENLQQELGENYKSENEIKKTGNRFFVTLSKK